MKDPRTKPRWERHRRGEEIPEPELAAEIERLGWAYLGVVLDEDTGLLGPKARDRRTRKVIHTINAEWLAWSCTRWNDLGGQRELFPAQRSA